MPTKVAEAYVSIRANTAMLMADMQTAKGAVGVQAGQMGASFPAGMAPGITAARAQINTIPLTTAKAAAKVKASTTMMGAGFKAFAAQAAGAMGLMAGGAALIMGGKAAVTFEDSLIKATAAMTGAEEKMGELEQVARDWGIEAGVGASKAADALGFLALAGYDADKSMAALPLVMKFAGAGAFDAATSSDILTDAMSALRLASDDTETHMANMTRVADLMSKASVTANTSVQQLGEAMLMKAGPAAAAAGMEVEDLTAMLMIFADQGRKGSDAGTLAAATIVGLSKSAAKFKDSGLNKVIFDSTGAMRPLKEIVQGLTDEFGHLSVEERTAMLMQLGVNKQAADGVNLLIGQVEQLDRYGNALSEAGGATDELSQKKWKSMAAQLGVLKAMFADFAIAIMGPLVSALISVLKPIARIFVWIGRWSEAHGDLIPTIIKVTAAMLGLKFVLPLVAFGIRLVAKAIMGVMISNPYTIIIMALVLMIKFLYDAYKAGSGWMKPVGDGIRMVVGKLKEMWVKLKEVIAVFAQKMLPLWEKLKAVGRAVLDFINARIKQFTDMMDSEITDGRTGWETAWETIRNVTQGVIDLIVGYFNFCLYVWEGIIGAMVTAWNFMFGTTFEESISGAWGAFVGWISRMLDALSLLTTNWSLTWALIKEVTYMRFLQITHGFKTFVDYVIIGLAYTVGAFVAAFKSIWDHVKYTFAMMKQASLATFAGMIAVAKAAWMKITGRGKGKELGEHFMDAVQESIDANPVEPPKTFAERQSEEAAAWGGTAVTGAQQRQQRRRDEIDASKDRANAIVDEMRAERTANRAEEDAAKEDKLKTVEEVGDAEEEKNEEVAQAFVRKLTEVQPEIGFKGVAEFGRSLQEAMLKEKDKEKARDDKQAKDTTGILDASERSVELQEQQLEEARAQADMESEAGLSGPG